MDHRRSNTPRRALAAGLLLLAGCAGPSLRPLDPRHPASAEAPEGTLYEPSALRDGRPEPDAAPPSAAPDHQGGSHHAH